MQSGSCPRLLDPVLAHLLPEVLAGDAEGLRGVGAVAVDGLEDAADVRRLGLAHDLLQRDERVAVAFLAAGLAAAAERALEEDVAGEHARRGREGDRALDGVL